MRRNGRTDGDVAVTYEDGGIFQHFGHTKQFKLYEVNGGDAGNPPETSPRRLPQEQFF